jgi:hypothetical protein
MQFHTIRRYREDVLEREPDVFGCAAKRTFGRKQDLPFKP